MASIDINGIEYELKYNMKRIELIENAMNASIMASLSKSNGMLPISSLKTYFAYGLKNIESDAFESTKKAMDICENMIMNEGYIKVCSVVLEALERDCPFFFQNL